MDEPPVAILLSTWNGAAHLPEQLASFTQQQNVRWHLYWRDDGSSDGTPDCMRAFAAEHPAQVTFCPTPAGHIGITASFLALLRQAPAATIAFADQDDVWLPEKLDRGTAALARVPDTEPALYCARQTLVDAALHPIGPSPRLGLDLAFPRALTQNVATGCTVMLNPAAARLVAASQAPPGTLHDWWAYLVVSAAGGRILADDTQVVLYRQHARNAVGVASIWQRGLAAVQRGPGAFMALFRAHVQALREQPDLLSPAARTLLDKIAHGLADGVLPRLPLLAQPGLRRQTASETFLFRLWFLLG